MSLPRGTVGWSVVCVCDIPYSYSLTLLQYRMSSVYVLTFVGFHVNYLNTLTTRCLVFKQLPRDPVNVKARNNMCDGTLVGLYYKAILISMQWRPE